MRIAIDTRDLQIAKTGSKTYLEELCKVFPLIMPEYEFVFLQPKWKIPDGQSNITKILNHLAFYWWKELELPWLAWRNRCELIFCTDYVVPFISLCPTVPVFYDANFWANPEQYNHLWRKLLDIFAIPAAKRALFVATISEFSRQEIAKYTGISLEKIIAIPIASKSIINTSSSTSEDVDRISNQYNVELDTPFILHVGVMEKRKNLPRLIEAFAYFQQKIETPYNLILVGQPAKAQDMDDSETIHSTIKRVGLEDKVILPGYVSDNDLAVFYQQAIFFAFPSLREGFGIPILEAFHSGTPVIAANNAAIPEVAGDAALFFAPLDVVDITRAMFEVASDQTLREKLVEMGYERARQFSWIETARKLLDVIEQMSVTHNC